MICAWIISFLGSEGPLARALRMSAVSVGLSTLVYGLAGIGILNFLPSSPSPAPPAAEPAPPAARAAEPLDLAGLKAQLAEQLFCSCAPCPETPCSRCPEAAAPPGLHWWFLVFLAGLIIGISAASCCCGAFAGAIFWRGEAQRDVRPRGAVRAIAPASISW